MLRTKLLRYFIGLIILFALLSLWFGIRVINQHIIEEAQERTRLDLRSAWSVYDAAAKERLAALRLLTDQPFAVDACMTTSRDSSALRQQLHATSKNVGFDFLTLASAQGEVILRAAPPYNTGASCLDVAGLDRVLAGEEISGTVLLSASVVEREAEGLAERAYMEVEDTPKSRRSPKQEEKRAMVLISAAPVFTGPTLVGVLYGGVVLNRNSELIDLICTSVYGTARKDGSPLGTATIFLQDTRIATTVLRSNGNRAIGSTVSKEVADTVLDNSRPWIGRAFVVNDWYLTAYDPIRDLSGSVIGMLYVGTLEKPFKEIGRAVIYRYIVLTGMALLLAFLSALVLAHNLARPIHELAQATDELRSGATPKPVAVRGASNETDRLALAFNEMAHSLQEREQSLRRANSALEIANHNYMDLLGFASHELKSPMSVMVNYVYLLKQEALGSLTDKQKKAVDLLDRNISRMTEMVRHYLNLSRIEEGLLNPIRSEVNMLNDVLIPLIESSDQTLQKRCMSISNCVSANHIVHADINMMREVFENLLSNAIKYGREGGKITISGAEEEAFIRFAVRNEGEGIPHAHLGRLFQKFSRIEDLQAASKQKGTGLGLFITRTIVEAHNGHIEADSEPGSWTEFRFTVPRYDGDREQATPTENDTPKPKA